jgi:hypothetical protein
MELALCRLYKVGYVLAKMIHKLIGVLDATCTTMY